MQRSRCPSRRSDKVCQIGMRINDDDVQIAIIVTLFFSPASYLAAADDWFAAHKKSVRMFQCLRIGYDALLHSHPLRKKVNQEGLRD